MTGAGANLQRTTQLNTVEVNVPLLNILECDVLPRSRLWHSLLYAYSNVLDYRRFRLSALQCSTDNRKIRVTMLN